MKKQKRGSCQPHEPRLFSGCHEPITRESGGVPCRTQRRARSRRTRGAICGCAIASLPERLSVPTAQDHGKPQSTASRPGEFPFTKRLSALRLRNCLPALPFLAGSPGVPAEEQPTASGFAIQRPFDSALRSAWQYVTRVKRVSCLVRRFRVPLAAAYDTRSGCTGIGTDDRPGIGIRAPEHQTIRCARGAVESLFDVRCEPCRAWRRIRYRIRSGIEHKGDAGNPGVSGLAIRSCCFTIALRAAASAAVAELALRAARKSGRASAAGSRRSNAEVQSSLAGTALSRPRP